MQTFHDYAYYYNMFYNDKNYNEEAEVICNFISQFAVLDYEKRILNIGCGTGRHDRELDHRGFRVHGIDLSTDMIRIAEISKGTGHLTYEVADARNFKVAIKYDIAISLFHVMSYQNTNSDLYKVFRCVNNALNDNGIFIFDVWYGPGVLTDRPSIRVKRVEDDKNFFVRIAEPVLHPNENIVDVNYSVHVIEKLTGVTKVLQEVHNMRYYFKPEIEEMLTNSGFELLKCIDCTTQKKPDFNSWTVYFIAKKCAVLN